MAKTTKSGLKAATTPEARENQLVALAMDRAEEQLMNGTASSQIISHFLRLGTIRAQVELEELRNKNALLAAKTEQIQSSQRVEELVSEAMEAFRGYSGGSNEEEMADEYYYPFYR